jgi:hypothetical protein
MFTRGLLSPSLPLRKLEGTGPQSTMPGSSSVQTTLPQRVEVIDIAELWRDDAAALIVTDADNVDASSGKE